MTRAGLTADQHPWLSAGANVAVITHDQGRSVTTWRVKRRTATTVLLWRQVNGHDREMRVSLSTLEKREPGPWSARHHVVPWDAPEAVSLRDHQRRAATAAKVIELLRPLSSRTWPVLITDDEWGEVAEEAERLLMESRPLPAVSTARMKPPEVEVHVTPGAESNADAGEEGVVHLVCPHDGCRAVDQIAVVEDAGEVELGMNNGAYFVDGDLVVDFATSDEYVDTEWQDKHVCQACQQPVTMPDYAVSYNGAGF